MLNELRNRNTMLIAGIALIIGVLFGWWVLGWGVFPVEYVNGNPTQLAQTYKDQHIQLVADSYAIEQNKDLANQRLRGLERELPETLARLKAKAQSDRQDSRAARIQSLADGLGIRTATVPTTPPSAQGGPSILPLIGLLLILIGGVGLFYYWRSRRQVPVDAVPVPLRARDRVAPTAAPLQPTLSVETEAPQMPLTSVLEPEVGEAPLGHFITTYKLGDDGYDTSFSIETPSGEFLGECGVGISDVVGEGPQKVTAFEVWLFDKNDIKTVTKVLMSDYAYNNETIRKKLQARGDALLAQRGREIMLETEALQVNAVVSDMAYGSGGTPQSFFSKLTIELSPTIKHRVPA